MKQTKGHAFSVIGAGYGRTGTMSLKHALEALDFGPCFHMIELTNQPEYLPAWNSAFNGDFSLLRQLAHDFPATADFPGCLLYQELFQLNPEAKVILTVRKSEDWYASAAKTIFKSYPNRRQVVHILRSYLSSKRTRQLMRVGWMIQKRIYRDSFQYRLWDKEHCIAQYEKHNAEVIAKIPPDRLLVYDVSEGWEPLCRFLEVDIPDIPFPHTNRSDHFHKMKMQTLQGPVSEEMKRT